MSSGLSGWYGLLGLLVVIGGIATVLSVLGAAALRLMIQDDFFDKS